MSFGFFDYKKGGHFVLWDLGLVIEFPPGYTILIPSAILRHSNVSIQEGERRYSITQYTAGSLFRYVYNDFQSDISLKPLRTEADKEKIRRDAETRWEDGLASFTTWPLD